MRLLQIPVLLLGVAFASGVPAEEAQTAPGFAGSAACVECHADAAKNLTHSESTEKAGDCEGCHGPGRAHVDAEGKAGGIRALARSDAGGTSAVCVSCHRETARHASGNEHEAADVGCTSCHSVHAGRKIAKLLSREDPVELCFGCHRMQRVQTARSSHMPLRADLHSERKLTCSACHDAHGTPYPAMLRDRSPNENCYRCHADRRGPVLWEHPPVRESCMHCHSPHGSMHEGMLLAKEPRLCQNCHVDVMHPSEPRSAESRFVFNSGCLNCHAQVHGSNHPSGVRLMR